MFYKNITAPRSVVKKTPCFLTFGHDMRMTIWTNYKIRGEKGNSIVKLKNKITNQFHEFFGCFQFF